jgi:hypothetical protein
VAEIVTDQFTKILAAADVKRVSGIVGDNPNGSSDAIRRQGRIEGIFVFPLVLLYIVISYSTFRGKVQPTPTNTETDEEGVSQ